MDAQTETLQRLFDDLTSVAIIADEANSKNRICAVKDLRQSWPGLSLRAACMLIDGAIARRLRWYSPT